jgi:hypothetical protein
VGQPLNIGWPAQIDLVACDGIEANNVDFGVVSYADKFLRALAEHPVPSVVAYQGKIEVQEDGHKVDEE